MAVKGIKLNTLPTIYDGFNIIDRLWKHQEEMLVERDTKKEKKKNRWIIIPEAWENQYWFAANLLAKCLRWVAYEASGVKGLPLTVGQLQRMQAGRYGHYRVEKEFAPLALGKEILIFDPEYHIRGYTDLIARNYITGELFIVDFKFRTDWRFAQIKRKGIPEHLKDTPFYPPDSDDEIQIMLYIRMAKQCGLDIKYGVVIYEKMGDPCERKVSLIECNQKLIEKYLEKIKEMEKLLYQGKLIEPYIPVEASVHHICPFRQMCPTGRLALARTEPRKDIPLWILLKIRKEKKSREQVRLKKQKDQGDLFNL